MLAGARPLDQRQVLELLRREAGGTFRLFLISFFI